MCIDFESVDVALEKSVRLVCWKFIYLIQWAANSSGKCNPLSSKSGTQISEKVQKPKIIYVYITVMKIDAAFVETKKNTFLSFYLAFASHVSRVPIS